MAVLIRAGIPLPGGQLVALARDQGLPVLFSANAFMVRDSQQNIQRVRLADPDHFGALDAALDSAGFVAAVKYRGYPWSISQYLNLAQSYPWAWYAGMDYCVEPEVAGQESTVLFRMAETCRMYGELRAAARERGMRDPMPVLQGWTPAQYLWCADRIPLMEWPSLIGVGSMCRRHIHGPVGILACLDALDKILPAHTMLHLFGVKGQAMSVIGQHPRLASVDSMAWEAAARRDHPTGRNMELRGRYLMNWVARNVAAATGAQVPRTPSLLPTPDLVVPRKLEPWLDLVLSNDMVGPDAEFHAMRNFDHLPGVLGAEPDDDEDPDEEEMAVPAMM